MYLLDKVSCLIIIIGETWFTLLAAFGGRIFISLYILYTKLGTKANFDKEENFGDIKRPAAKKLFQSTKNRPAQNFKIRGTKIPGPNPFPIYFQGFS